MFKEKIRDYMTIKKSTNTGILNIKWFLKCIFRQSYT